MANTANLKPMSAAVLAFCAATSWEEVSAALYAHPELSSGSTDDYFGAVVSDNLPTDFVPRVAATPHGDRS